MRIHFCPFCGVRALVIDVNTALFDAHVRRHIRH